MSSIPALKNAENQWVLGAESKADLFADTFTSKCTLRAREVNDYTKLNIAQHEAQTSFTRLQECHTEEVLKKLREDSNTGPDHLPARI